MAPPRRCGSQLALLPAGHLVVVAAEPQWYSYFFFQQVGVGGAYATAICGMWLACALHARASGSLKHTVWSAGLLICVAFFKVQILLAYGVFFFLYIVWLAPRLDRRLKAVVAVLAVGISLLVVWKVNTIPNAPTLGLSLESIRQYFPRSTLLIIGLLPLAARDGQLSVRDQESRPANHR